MKIAAIDMGTNSFLCLVADVNDRGELIVISDQAKVVRLGEKVHQNRTFLPAALERAKNCLQDFRKEIDKHRPEKIIATATSAARDVQNGGELKKICDDLKIPLHIIEGKREAELSFTGALSSLPHSDKVKVLVVDVGGGSTELIYKEPGKNLKSHSFDLGCVRLTEMFLSKDPVDAQELKMLRDYSEKTFSSFGKLSPDVIIAVAGTPTTLACVDQKITFNEEKVEGFILTRSKIRGLLELLAPLPIELRKSVKGLDPGRADVIVAGAVLLDLCLDLAQSEEMCVSTRGLRFGVALRHKEFA